MIHHHHGRCHRETTTPINSARPPTNGWIGHITSVRLVNVFLFGYWCVYNRREWKCPASRRKSEREKHTWNHNNTGIRLIEIGTGSVKWRRVEVILFQTRNQRVGVTPLDSPTDHTAYHQLQRGGGHSVTVEENISFVVVIAKESPREREWKGADYNRQVSITTQKHWKADKPRFLASTQII